MKKTVVVHIDGLPTQSFHELASRTVLQAANIPHLDELARHGEFGRLGVPKETRVFTGELAFLSLLGYDSQKWFGGPGAFEGKNLEVILDRNDVAYLCEFVTLRGEDGWGDGKKLGSSLVMDDVAAGGLETEEARELIDAINEQLVSESIQFYAGEQSTHLMVWVGGNSKVGCRNPREVLGQPIDGFLATGNESQVLRELMEASRMILRHHPLNQERVNDGLKPANCLWPWGQSKVVDLPLLKDRWSIQGAVVSPSGPYRGVGITSGLKAVTVEHISENEPEWLQKMVDLTQKILEKLDLACLHIPVSPTALSQEQATHVSRFVERVQQLDEYVIAPLQRACVDSGDIRLLVVATPGVKSVHECNGASPVPYVIYEGEGTENEDSPQVFNEEKASQSPLHNATMILERFFGKP